MDFGKMVTDLMGAGYKRAGARANIPSSRGRKRIQGVDETGLGGAQLECS